MSEATAKQTPFSGRTIGLLSSLLAVLAALGVGAVILGASGFNPLTAYGAILEGSFGTQFALGETLAKAAPLAIVGMGAAVALRAGAITIGAQGQLIAGSIGALLTSMWLADAPSFAAIPAGALGGAIFGMAWVLIPAFLRSRMGVNEILSTLLFNEFAFLLLSYLLNNPLKQPLSYIPQSEKLPDSSALGAFWGSTQISAGMLVVALVTLLFFVWTRSVMSYRYDLYGENPTMAHSLGISGKQVLFNSLLISGAAAGLAGWMQAASLQRVYVTIAEDIGYFGLVAAMLGGGRPLGILAASLLVGILQSGGLHMQATENIPHNLGEVIEALILLGFAVRYAPQIVALLGRAVRSVTSVLRLEREPAHAVRQELNKDEDAPAERDAAEASAGVDASADTTSADAASAKHETSARQTASPEKPEKPEAES